MDFDCFSVNRMMKRISKLSYDHHTTPPPPITPIEPFEEQERTGYLFGSHKHHYLRVKRPMSPAKSSYPTTRTSGDLDGPSSAGSKISFQHTPTQSEGAEEEEGYEPEMWEGDADQSRPLTSRPSQTGALADFLRQQSLTQARKYFGLDEGELRKNFEITPNPCVEAVHDDKVCPFYIKVPSSERTKLNFMNRSTWMTCLTTLPTSSSPTNENSWKRTTLFPKSFVNSSRAKKWHQNVKSSC